MNGRTLTLGSLLAASALAVIAALSFWPGSANAAMFNLTVPLTEAAAMSTCDPNPPPSGGGGSGMVSYDTDSNLLSWNISFSNLSGSGAVAAHFHGPATPAENAGIQVTIGDLSSPSVGSATITEMQEAQLLGGLWYINYHTAACADGEIRGQVSGNGVGGVAELPDVVAAPMQTPDSSGSNAGWIMGLTAAAVAGVSVLSAGVWVTRRRWLA